MIRSERTSAGRSTASARLNSDVSRLLKYLQIPAEVYIHFDDEPADQPIQPSHLKHIKLLDKLSPRQRAVLIKLMESMVEV